MIDCEQQKESEFLRGAYDLHIHTGPDVIPRKLTGKKSRNVGNYVKEPCEFNGWKSRNYE